MKCIICGCSNFIKQNVLWPELCNSWELTSVEVDYINEQQGMRCQNCRCNLRSQALAKSLLSVTQENCLFNEFHNTSSGKTLKILEINSAGDLHHYLNALPNHKLVEYPAYDMMSLDIPDKGFDLVIHSDTLEHISDPVKALQECRRVLTETGACLFTVPIVVGRLTRSRSQMSPSYHGAPGDNLCDFLVYSEFGADVWKIPLLAGFSRVCMHQMKYPSAFAVEARC